MSVHEPESWLSVIRALIDYHVPRVQATPEVMVFSGLAVTAGLLLVFSTVALARPMVATVGLVVGGFAGYLLAPSLGTSAPLTAALGGVSLALAAFKTYRLWLVLATAAVAATVVAAAQTDRAALTQVLMRPQVAASEMPTLPAPDEQLRNLHGGVARYGSQVWERAKAHYATQGPSGILLPGLAGVLAILLGLRAARWLAAPWLAAVGAVTTFGGIATLLCAKWPDLRPELTARPQWVLGGIAALWLIGLLSQVRHVRWARPKPESPATSDAKK